MTEKYSNKWIEQIMNLQQEDGSWGYFHTLSQPTNPQDISTEQALRRLFILGLTKSDEPIKRALNYLHRCVNGYINTPDRREKVLNWDAFEKHMLAAWIRIFDPDDRTAIDIATMWSEIITASFSGVIFDDRIYQSEYRKHIPILNRGERLIDISQFYMVTLLKGMLDEQTERRYIDFVINYPKGIYYVYPSRISETPEVFASLKTSHYLAALEQLIGYSSAGDKLNFAKSWILSNRDDNLQYDLGSKANDGVYFPLSDSWRRVEDRKLDCSFRIENLLDSLYH